MASPNLFNLSTLLPPGYSAAIAQASKSIEHFFSQHPAPAEDSPIVGSDNQYVAVVNDFLAGRTALENTSILLAVCTFCVLAMSWTSRFGNLGRFSPFTRSPPQGSTRVSDADFSYITADDLRKHEADSLQPSDSPVDYGPSRDTDVLIIKNKKREYAIHFPAYSIAKGELMVGQVREHAAKKMGTADARRVKLLYRGKNLKDDSRTCRHEGLRDGSELMCTMADSILSPSGSEDDDDDDEFVDLDGGEQAGADGEPRRKRNRGKKSKRRNKRDQQDSTLGVPPSQSSTRGPSPSRRPAEPVPNTPMGKLQALNGTLQSFVAQVDAFLASPPADPAKRDFERKALSETILAQVLLKLDAVDSEGNEEARMRRKELVKETQKVLQELDAATK